MAAQRGGGSPPPTQVSLALGCAGRQEKRVSEGRWAPQPPLAAAVGALCSPLLLLA